MIQEITSFLNNINRTSSTNDKIKVLSEASGDIKKVLYYAYSPFINFGITSANLIKRNDLCDKNNNDELFSLLDKLNTRQLTGHAAISAANGFIYNNNEYTDLLYLIIDKDLKIRIGAKVINKVFNNLIPEFSIALGESYNDKVKSKISFDEPWFISRKLDGVRCLTIIDENKNIKFLSRAGKEFETLENLKDEIKKLNISSCVLDGEICKSSDTHDDFQGLMKEIRKKDHKISDFKYYVFDYINVSDFEKCKSNNTLSQRINKLNLINDLKYIEILKQTPVFSQTEMDLFIDNFKNDKSKSNWEGLIARKNTKYEGKRSRDILKIKLFHDDEYIVKSVEFAPFRYVVNGKEIEEEMLSSIIIEHKGNKVNVGSGFTIEQRKYYHLYPEDIIGKTVCIQYFEETTNQFGEISLRFPVIKTIYDSERDM